MPALILAVDANAVAWLPVHALDTRVVTLPPTPTRTQRAFYRCPLPFVCSAVTHYVYAVCGSAHARGLLHLPYARFTDVVPPRLRLPHCHATPLLRSLVTCTTFAIYLILPPTDYRCTVSTLYAPLSFLVYVPHSTTFRTFIAICWFTTLPFCNLATTTVSSRTLPLYLFVLILGLSPTRL